MTTAQSRIGQLSRLSARIVEPDEEVAGEIDLSKPVLPRDLLSISGLDVDLPSDQWRMLAREELASILDAGIRFEALLLAGFGRQLAYTPELVDDRVVYALHELGEETRHSRLFVRLLGQLDPTASNPLTRGPIAAVDRIVTAYVLRRPLLFLVMVLAGEELPDLFQKIAAEHPDTDPFVRAVNRYHRAEEARHIGYARVLLPEVWADATPVDRAIVRWLGPSMLRMVADSLVHPGVYRVVGLAGWMTWWRANRTATRQRFRATAFRPVLRALVDAGAFGPNGPVTRSWRRVTALP